MLLQYILSVIQFVFNKKEYSSFLQMSTFFQLIRKKIRKIRIIIAEDSRKIKLQGKLTHLPFSVSPKGVNAFFHVSLMLVFTANRPISRKISLTGRVARRGRFSDFPVPTGKSARFTSCERDVTIYREN